MRIWTSLIMLFILLAFPVSGSAQNQITLGTVSIQFWPEYDQPSMLVIYDFTVSESTALPVDLAIRIPLDANLSAVAYEEDGTLLNASVEAPILEDDWQVITLTANAYTMYHLEYYAPISRDGLQRTFTFQWPGDYATQTFDLRLRLPLDTTEVTTDPEMVESPSASGDDTYLEWNTENLRAGQKIPVAITYTKTSEKLATSGAAVQAGQVNEDTPGRVSLNNYLPYIFAVLGLFLILAGGYYFWRSGFRPTPARRRRRSASQSDTDEQIYCHQCGQRAQAGDRFCRTCGTRLRLDQ